MFIELNSYKFFFIFSCLTLITLTLGIFGFYSLKNTRADADRIMSLQDFSLRLEHLSTITALTRAELRLSKKQDIFNKIKTAQTRVKTMLESVFKGLLEAACGVTELTLSIENFHKAFLELLDQYDRHGHLIVSRNQYFTGIEQLAEKIEDLQAKRFFTALNTLRTQSAQISRTLNLKTFSHLNETQNKLLAAAAKSPEINELAQALFQNIEDDLFLNLAISSNENTLKKSSDNLLQLEGRLDIPEKYVLIVFARDISGRKAA